MAPPGAGGLLGDGTNTIPFSAFDTGDIIVVLGTTFGHAGCWSDALYSPAQGLSSHCIWSANVTPVNGVQLEQPIKYRAYDRAYGLWVPSKASCGPTVIGYCMQQKGEPYDILSSKTDQSRWYCSKLPWAGWKLKAGVDLDAADCTPAEPVPGPVIGVLSYAPERIVLVGPVAMSVVGEVPLRSMGVDLTPLSRPRGFAVAQCGGVGSSADDAVALVGLDGPPVAGYVELESPNPGSVELLPCGTLAVGHGLVVPEGSVWSLVDPVERALVEERALGNIAASPVVAAGFLWTVGAEVDDLADGDITLRCAPSDLATSSVVGRPGGEGWLIAADRPGAATLLRVTSGEGEALIERLDAASLATVRSVRLTGLRDRISSVTAAGSYLVLVDATGEDVSDSGGPLIVLDAVSLEEAGRIDAGGSISEVAALNGLLYAVTWTTGELLEIDPEAGEVLRRVRIPGAEGRMLEVAAVP